MIWTIDNGDLMKSADYYSHIIEIAPKTRKRRGMKRQDTKQASNMREGISHYEKYVVNFPDSSRAQEDYNIAKNCE